MSTSPLPVAYDDAPIPVAYDDAPSLVRIGRLKKEISEATQDSPRMSELQSSLSKEERKARSLPKSLGLHNPNYGYLFYEFIACDTIDDGEEEDAEEALVPFDNCSTLVTIGKLRHNMSVMDKAMVETQNSIALSVLNDRKSELQSLLSKKESKAKLDCKSLGIYDLQFSYLYEQYMASEEAFGEEEEALTLTLTVAAPAPPPARINTRWTDEHKAVYDEFLAVHPYLPPRKIQTLMMERRPTLDITI